MKLTSFKLNPLTRALTLSLALGASVNAYAEETETEQEVEVIKVTGSLGSLPGQDVESVFGFGKSILETPRAASTISLELMERFDVSDIDELVAFAPGTFTQSFFGVAGSLDVRGTPGETYFRGVKRLDNPGNYPTPIGASSSVDIVRGPASPIYGPSKIGGYLNFNPKSARVSRGLYLDDNTGGMSYTAGSWDKSVMSAEVGGPTKLAGKDAGFYFYGEIENSGSYYDNTSTDQTVLQAAFDMNLTDDLHIEFGAMHHKYEGNQVAGWNRLTQELIDNGTYVTGSPTPLDTNGDGSISHQEYDAVGHLINPFFGGGPATVDPSGLATEQGLVNPGTTTLRGNQVLVAEDDTLENDVTTLYFDVIYYTDSDWEIKNQLFYEGYENLNENAYGFSQFHDSWVVENKLVFAKEYEADSLIAQVQISPSARYTDFLHGDDFDNEYFDRRDLTGPSTPLDRRLLATRIDDDYANYDEGNYLDLGFAVMTDMTWDNGLNIVLGARYDSVDIETKEVGEKLLVRTRVFDDSPAVPKPDREASDTVGGFSWNTSISFKTELGLIPYFTAAKQATIVAGQGAEIGVGQVIDDEGNTTGNAFADSTLRELGVKGSFLEDSLYFALAVYEQERTDFSAQNTVTNNTTKNEGVEAELRWVVNDSLVLSAGYTHSTVENLTAQQNGSQFSFFGAEDIEGVTAASLYGGSAIGLIQVADVNPNARKAGVPENIYSMTATYDFQNGYATNVSVINADSTTSGFSNAVTLPSYTLVNAGVSYQTKSWGVNLTVKNLTDERYFRSNFPDLFGSQIVLPELPRSWNATFKYKF